MLSRKEYNDKYYKENQSKILEQKKQYRIDNLDKIKQYDRNRDKEKKAAYNKAWRERNKEKEKIRKHNLYIKNIETIKEKRKLYHKKNKDKIKERKRRYRSENRKKVNDSIREWQRKNRDKTRLASKMHYMKNPEIYKINGMIRRERKRRAGEKLNISNDFINLIKIKFLNKCFNCDTTDDLCIDHHYPLSKGGSLNMNNAVLLCRSCNSSKHNKFPELFYSKDQLLILREKYSIYMSNH
jgi:5-methylcytosine-specific restriction endonuclease McrA